jgi:hypothetical protein
MQLVDGAVRDGLTLEGAVALANHAQTQGRAPAGLLWHWLDDVHRWRSVLDDADLAARERRARLAPSERVVDRGPVRVADVL